jgi:hypothetical protein
MTAVSTRAGKLALIASLTVVLGFGIVILRLVRTAASDVPPPASPAGPSSPTAAPIPTTASEPPHAPPPKSVGHAIASPTAPTLDPAPAANPRRDIPRDENGNLVPVINVRLLREQLGRTDAPMTACLAQQPARATGKATLAFAVAAKDGKLVVESTSISDADTLAAYPDLLACMQQTADALAPFLDQTPPANPGATIYVRRHVRVDNGAVAENTIFDFSYFPRTVQSTP